MDLRQGFAHLLSLQAVQAKVRGGGALGTGMQSTTVVSISGLSSQLF
jgi:hypothetical protein